MSWDLNLCMQQWDRVVVPFHYLVKPEPQLTSASLRGSFPFFHLPIDLQLIVYEHCDSPTLFQLMRTCSRVRRAAMKLFWENTFAGQWYHCPDYWLFEHKVRTYTFTRHCPEFALWITNIEIDLIRLELRFQEDGEDCDDRVRESTISKAKNFWAKVEKVFPSAKRVILTGCTPREASPPPPGESDDEYSTIETVVDCAPTHIQVGIAFVAFPNPERYRSPRHTLWRAGSRAQPTWRALDTDWKPTRVLLPGRKWAVSPLGDFLKFNSRYHTILLEMRGIEWLMIESYVRYAVQDIIHCPRLDCSATYTQRVSWKQHLSESGHGRFDIRCQSDGDPMLQLFCYKHTPEAEKLAIEARQQHIDTHSLEAAKVQRRVGYGWGPPGSEQRRLFEEEFTAQMREESLYTPDEPGPDEMSVVDQYLDSLYMWFDRGHIYHGCSGTEKGHVCYGE